MNFIKLNARGMAHEFLAVAIVAIFAIGGVAYIVASHADQCRNAVSGSTSAPASSSNCKYSVSGPASAPVSGQKSQLAGGCRLIGVPSKPAYGSVIQPKVYIKNLGRIAFVPKAFVSLDTLDEHNHWQAGKGGPIGGPNGLGLLQPGHGITTSTGLVYTVPNATPNATKVRISVKSTSPGFRCWNTMQLPGKA